MELADGQTEYFCLPDVPSQREVEKTLVDEAFFQCILNGGPPPVSARDGLRVMELWTRFTVPTGKGAISRFRLQGNVNHWITI